MDKRYVFISYKLLQCSKLRKLGRMTEEGKGGDRCEKILCGLRPCRTIA